MKVAEALLLRKQLEAKVRQLEPIKQLGDQGIFEIKTQRTKISEEVDQVVMQIPKITLSDVTTEYDRYASELRKLDASIQESNWVNEVNYTGNPFAESEKLKAKKTKEK